VTADELRLADWLQRLVQALQAAGLGRQLAAVCAGRSALLALDEARVVLTGRVADDGSLTVHIAAADIDGAANHLRTRGDVLRALIDGRLLLDAAVASGAIDLRAPLADVLALHELVLQALALGPRQPGLRVLWAEFDAAWPGAAPRCNPIDAQRARYGALRDVVPHAVQLARSPLGDGAGSGDVGGASP
jgi:hypothetical protein